MDVCITMELEWTPKTTCMSGAKPKTCPTGRYPKDASCQEYLPVSEEKRSPPDPLFVRVLGGTFSASTTLPPPGEKQRNHLSTTLPLPMRVVGSGHPFHPSQPSVPPPRLCP
ncbi:hypothetical protein CEXT_166031 [Caerostris extrusa]|uniref:Uncharacterized protein n=1 Tax=Caerostris extrusa TaxID=172846 RepID=A0AAV4V8Q6_CAEEX|nr:hypothetical protein CEXT_166031 [Caerostris extrusa]